MEADCGEAHWAAVRPALVGVIQELEGRSVAAKKCPKKKNKSYAQCFFLSPCFFFVFAMRTFVHVTEIEEIKIARDGNA